MSLFPANEERQRRGSKSAACRERFVDLLKALLLVRFDIKTEKFQSWIIPGGGGVVRNMKSTPDGNLVMAESGVNKVGLVLVGSKAANSSQ